MRIIKKFKDLSFLNLFQDLQFKTQILVYFN